MSKKRFFPAFFAVLAVCFVLWGTWIGFQGPVADNFLSAALSSRFGCRLMFHDSKLRWSSLEFSRLTIKTGKSDTPMMESGEGRLTARPNFLMPGSCIFQLRGLQFSESFSNKILSRWSWLKHNFADFSSADSVRFEIPHFDFALLRIRALKVQGPGFSVTGGLDWDGVSVRKCHLSLFAKPDALSQVPEKLQKRFLTDGKGWKGIRLTALPGHFAVSGVSGKLAELAWQ